MKLCLAAFVGSALSCALAQDMPELSFNGSAEVRSAYLSRGKVVGRVGTHPTQRAVFRAFRDFNPLNDLGSG